MSNNNAPTDKSRSQFAGGTLNKSLRALITYIQKVSHIEMSSLIIF